MLKPSKNSYSNGWPGRYADKIDKLEGPFFCPKISSRWPQIKSFFSLNLASFPTVVSEPHLIIGSAYGSKLSKIVETNNIGNGADINFFLYKNFSCSTNEKQKAHKMVKKANF